MTLLIRSEALGKALCFRIIFCGFRYERTYRSFATLDYTCENLGEYQASKDIAGFP